MTDALPPPPTATGRSNRSVALVVLAVVALLAMAVIAWVVVSVMEANEAPSFPSVADQPAPAVTGTAVFDDYDCLRAVSLDGGEPVELTCEKDTTVVLVDRARFLDTGELEVVLVTEGPEKRRLVFAFEDGAVRQVSDELQDGSSTPADAPTGPDGATARVVNADGSVEVLVSGPEGERSVLRAEAGDAYELGDPLWVPDTSALVLHDNADRLLLVTTDADPTTRVLQEGAAQVWAVTDQDLLATG